MQEAILCAAHAVLKPRTRIVALKVQIEANLALASLCLQSHDMIQ